MPRIPDFKLLGRSEGPRAAKLQQQQLVRRRPQPTRSALAGQPKASAPKPQISPGATSPTLIAGLNLHQQRLAHTAHDAIQRQGIGPALVQRKQIGRK